MMLGLMRKASKSIAEKTDGLIPFHQKKAHKFMRPIPLEA
jgi:hypothetical protein